MHDEACYAHELLKAASEKESSGDTIAFNLYGTVFSYLLWIHKQQIEEDGWLQC